MIVDNADLETAIAHMRTAGTDLSCFEVKSASGGFPKDVDRSFVALANTHGGSVILGISESRGFHAVDDLDVKSTQQHCAQIARELIEPPLQVDISVLEFEKRPVVVANVDELTPRYKPCYLKKHGMQNGSFVRTGDGDHKMSRYEIDRFIENQIQNARNDVALVEEATIDDLDRTAVAKWADHARASSFGRDTAMDDLLLMANRRIVDKDDDGVLRPTLAGLLALGTYPQKFYPRLNVVFTCYPGSEKGALDKQGRRFVDTKTIDGPIPEMVAQTVNAVSRNIRHGALIEGAVREDLPDYPLPVVREAVANALMHRDYSKDAQGTPVLVDLFPDRLVITNPGGLYGTMTIEALGEKGGTSSRNQFLSRILEDAAYVDYNGRTGQVVENRGSGYPTILSELENALMDKPVVTSTLDEFGFSVRHRRMTAYEDARYSKENVARTLLDYVEKHGSAGTGELSSVLGLSTKTTRTYINALVAQGALEPVGRKNDPNRTYRLP